MKTWKGHWMWLRFEDDMNQMSQYTSYQAEVSTSVLMFGLLYFQFRFTGHGGPKAWSLDLMDFWYLQLALKQNSPDLFDSNSPQVFRAGLPWRRNCLQPFARWFPRCEQLEHWSEISDIHRYPTFSVMQIPWCSMMLSFLFEVLRRDPECTSVHADFFASAWRILQKHTNSFQSVRWFTDVWFVVRFQVGRDVVEGGRVAVRLESTASRGRDCQSVGAVKLVEELWRFKHKRS